MQKSQILFAAIIIVMASLGACTNDNETPLEVPESYSFERDGSSTVSFTGQTQRLDMLQELGSYAKSGNSQELSEQTMLDMLNNENDPFSNSELNQSGDSRKQLGNKIFGLGGGATPADGGITKDEIEAAIAKQAEVSKSFAEDAAEGQAGTISSGSSTYLVDENGIEWAQIIEKTLMGAVLFHQGTNVYLGPEKLGANGTELAEGANYTSKEHHVDEAWGYMEIPTDLNNLDNADLRFWAKYARGRNGETGVGYDLIANFHEAFTELRANVAHEYELAQNDEEDAAPSVDEYVQTINKEWEIVVAATAVHYFNSSIENATDRAKFFHALSEGWAFVECLRFANNGNGPIDGNRANEIQNTIGNNFWQVSLDDLNTAKQMVIDAYPELESVKDQL